MLSKLFKIISPIVVLLLLIIIGDHFYYRYQVGKLGPGFELKPGQTVDVEPEKLYPLDELKPGSEIEFLIRPKSMIATMGYADNLFEDCKLIAKVKAVQQVDVLKRKIAFFDFVALKFPSGARVAYQGTVRDRNAPDRREELPIIGSFVGMEGGPGGIVIGWIAGIFATSFFGRHFDPKPSCITADIGPMKDQDGVPWLIEVQTHFCEYIPYTKAKTPNKPSNEKGASRAK